jgi:CheY-like chemotaxis protein
VDQEIREALGIAACLPKPLRGAALHQTVGSLFPESAAHPLPTEQPEEPCEGLDALDVLLVEDNPVNLEVGMGMLEKLGCRITTAGNGREALGAMQEHRFDVVLMDCQMPEMDGFDATRERRRIERADRLEPAVIIALTANAVSGDRERCLAAGMDDYLAKPFTLVQISEMLRRWSTSRPALASSATA